MIEELDERIDVLAAFDREGMRPRIFVWRGRRYKTAAITAAWIEPYGSFRRYRFAVRAEGPDIYELCFDQGKMIWSLARVHAEG